MRLPPVKRLGYTRRQVLTALLGIVLVYAFINGWFDIEVGF